MSTELGVALVDIKKVSSLSDGGARITLDIGYQDIELIKKLLELSMSPQSICTAAFVEPLD